MTRATFAFNPKRDYGPATASIAEIVRTWGDVDWFVPPAGAPGLIAAADPAENGAVDDVMLHTALARAHVPDRFAHSVAVRVIHGSWDEFLALCDHPQRDVMLGANARPRPAPFVPAVVVDERWDWKFGALKQLCYQHSTAKGWTLEGSAYRLAASDDPGAIFVNYGKHVSWRFRPELDARVAVTQSPHACAAPALNRCIVEAGWYHGYANMDATHAIEWQLSSNAATLDDNPFFPLLRVYARGFLPFSFRKDEVVLFAFTRTRT